MTRKVLERPSRRKHTRREPDVAQLSNRDACFCTTASSQGIGCSRLGQLGAVLRPDIDTEVDILSK